MKSTSICFLVKGDLILILSTNVVKLIYEIFYEIFYEQTFIILVRRSEANYSINSRSKT
jgi:hypothetical protein